MPLFVLTFILTLLTTFSATSSLAEEVVPEKPVQVGLQSYKIENSSFLAINFQNYPGWHTYWKNPGDAGLAIKNQFLINGREIKLTEEEWPAPKRFIENGTQWAYGYDGNYSLFFRLAKNELNKYSGKKILLRSTWLVCKHICIPGQIEVNFQIVSGKIVTTNSNLMNPLDELELSSRFMNLPKLQTIPDYLDIQLSKGQKDKTLILSYEVKKTTDAAFLKEANLIYAFPIAPFDFEHENLLIKESSLAGIVQINWDGEYSTPPEVLPTKGIFQKPYLLRFLLNDPVQRKVIIIEKKFSHFNLDVIPTSSSTPIPLNLSPKIEASMVGLNSVNNSLVYYLALAFIGGFILNFMPCVLPIISLKLFGLVKYQNESRSKILRHNLFYTLGIVSTFIVFALIILSLKFFGTQVGWGFQLQSPNFIAIVAIVLFILSLNMFGLFEFGTPGGKSLGNIKTEDGLLGDFLSGVLATILSTPCSAPFLGTALTFAFTSNNSSIIYIFIMIGIGLAFPFIITGFFPNLVSFLPRPGNWMNTLKKVLGLTLILTITWLLDVYNALVDGSAHLIKLSTIFVFIFAAITLLKKERWMSLISFLAALFLLVNISTSVIVSSKDESTALIRDKLAQGLNWEAWSYNKMSEYKENRQAVFINFTAKWCFTCKINEKLVLDTENFKKFIIDNNIKLLIGDWTKRDEMIGRFLRENGLVGVPAYFVLKKNGTLVNLGETVSTKRIKDHLN